MAIIGVLKRNTCHIEECNANPYKSTRWQDQQLENIAKDKGKTEPDGLGYLNGWTFGPEDESDRCARFEQLVQVPGIHPSVGYRNPGPPSVTQSAVVIGDRDPSRRRHPPS